MSKTVDLMAALEASLAKAKAGKTTAGDLVVAASGVSPHIIHRVRWDRRTYCGGFFDQEPAPEGSTLTCSRCKKTGGARLR